MSPCRMGLPVVSPDKYVLNCELRGEGEEGESQSEACTPIRRPVPKKRRRGKKRYFTPGSPPFVLLRLFPINSWAT